VSLPDVIPVRYTEEEAGFVSFRPVVRQSFRLHELLDMVLSVTGKDAGRLQQILRSGTVVFHFYRYWWDGFEISGSELAALLSSFPDPQPSRPFDANACTLALFGAGGSLPGNLLELTRAQASQRRFLRRRTFWQALLAAAKAGPLAYAGYSYAHKGDLYRLELSAAQLESLIAAAQSLAPRNLRAELLHLEKAAQVVFLCPRNS
jgi:hypothetical protein